MKRIIAASLLAACAVGAAQAADNGIYFGAGIGQSRLKPDASRFDFSHLNYDDTDEGFKLIAGIRPLNWIGAEVNYVDLGRTHGIVDNSTGIRSDARLYDAFAVGYLPIPLPFIDVFGKVGVAHSDTRFRTAGFRSLDLDSTDFTWGAGVQARFGSLAARVEYEKFNLPQTNDASLVSVGVTWTFF